MKLLKVSIYAALIGLCVFFNVHIRLYPANFPQLKEQARKIVASELRNKTADETRESYSDYNPLIQKKIFQTELSRRKLTFDFEQKVQQKYKELKDPYQDKHGQTYLFELDPFHWARYSKLELKNGFHGDYKKGNNIYDSYMLSPVAVRSAGNPFLFKATVFLYKMSSIFISDLSFDKCLFYLPIFFTVLFLLSLLALTASFFNIETAIIAMFVAGLAPIVIGRGCAGWYDMDMLSLWFPVMIIGFIASAVDKRSFLNILLSLCAAFFTSLFAYTWTGWWFIFLVVLGVLGFQLLNTYSLYHEDRDWVLFVKRTRLLLCTLCFYLIGVFIFYVLFFDRSPLGFIYNQLLIALNIGKSQKLSILPDTYYTVGELQPGSMRLIFQTLFGGLVFVFSSCVMLCVYFKNRRTSKNLPILLLLFWFFFIMYASLKGVRFSMFLVVPLSIFFAVGFVWIVKYILVKLRVCQNRILHYLLIILLGINLGFVGCFFINRAMYEVERSYPLINDSWTNVLSQIKAETKSNTVINSWWDYGDWFKEVADRKVIFDGQSQHLSISYWMARALYSDNQREVLNILRMLNNSSYTLFTFVNEYLKDQNKTFVLVERLIMADRDEADSILSEYKLSLFVKQRLKRIIYDKPENPACFIVDKSMLKKTPAISFIANWNVAKLYIMRNIGKSKEDILNDLVSIFALTHDEAARLYDEMLFVQSNKEKNEVISKRYRFMSNVAEGQLEGDAVYFNDATVLNLDKETVKAYVVGKGFRSPDYASIFSSTDVVEIDNKEGVLKECFLFVEGEKGKWKAVSFSDPELVNSFLVRLFFVRGKGFDFCLPYIIDEENGIMVYKIDWNKNYE